MSSYKATMSHFVEVRGLDRNEEQDISILKSASVETLSGITAYHALTTYTYAYQTQTLTFNDFGIKCLALIYLVQTGDDNNRRVKATIQSLVAAVTTDLIGGVATFYKFDNRVLPSIAATDAIKLVVVDSEGATTYEKELVLGAKTTPQTIYDVIPLLQSALDAAEADNHTVFSVSDRMGVKIEVTGSTGNVITVIAPVAPFATDIRFNLFGDAAASTENLSTADSTFEGRVMTKYTPSELQVYIEDYLFNIDNVVTEFYVLGAI